MLMDNAEDVKRFSENDKREYVHRLAILKDSCTTYGGDVELVKRAKEKYERRASDNRRSRELRDEKRRARLSGPYVENCLHRR